MTLHNTLNVEAHWKECEKGSRRLCNITRILNKIDIFQRASARSLDVMRYYVGLYRDLTRRAGMI